MKTTSHSKRAAAFATVCASAAIAQTDGTYLLISSNDVSSVMPTTAIEIWATWTGPISEHVFTFGNYNLVADDGAFSNPVNVLNGPGSTTGVIGGNVVGGAQNGQLHFPITLGILGKSNNPILLATYDWTTTDFTPRAVSLETNSTNNFMVAYFTTGANSQLYPNEFSPGAGVITVVPSPASWLAVALPIAAGARRRRK